MPLRDYTCNACDHTFEKLVRHDESPVCPGCGSTDLHRELSAFAVGAGAPDSAPPSCGTCGGTPGACRFEPAH